LVPGNKMIICPIYARILQLLQLLRATVPALSCPTAALCLLRLCEWINTLPRLRLRPAHREKNHRLEFPDAAAVTHCCSHPCSGGTFCLSKPWWALLGSRCPFALRTNYLDALWRVCTIQQTSGKLPANVFKIHMLMLDVCWIA